MSSPPCISGGGRTYGFDIKINRSPSTTSSRSSPTASSPSSTLSEDSNSQLAISTRKPRTPRKRLNQTYNEAAALLSTAYPKIFPTKNNHKQKHLSIHNHSSRNSSEPLYHDSDLFYGSSSNLILPFQVTDPSAFLRREIVEKPQFQPKFPNFRENSPEVESETANPKQFIDDDDFDTESILDEEIGEGIDCIMGEIDVNNSINDSSPSSSSSSLNIPMRMGLGRGFDMSTMGMKMGALRAMRRHVEDGNRWCFQTVDVLEISPRVVINKPPIFRPISTKKKKKKVERTYVSEPEPAPENEIPIPKPDSGLILKLNYEEVVNAWSDRTSPFPNELDGSDTSGSDLSARLAQINLFYDGGLLREASVLRYKEKKRTRLLSKKIRYQDRKVNADRRPE